MKLLVQSFLAGLAAASNIARAGISVVGSDLQTLDQDYKNLKQQALNFDGGVAAVLPYENALQKVDKDTNQTGSDVASSSVFTVAESQSFVNYITNTLEPDINSTLKAIVAGKPQLQSSGILAAVRNELIQIKSDTDRLGTIMISKSPSASKAGLQSAFNKIDADFNAAIAALGGGGVGVTKRERATFAQIDSDFKALRTAIDQETRDLKAYTGGVNGAIELQNDANKIDSDIKQLSTDINNLPAATSAQAQSIINYLGTLEPSVKNAVTALIAKKPQLVAAGLGASVCSDLKQEYSDTVNLCSACEAKTPSSKKSAMQMACSKILADLQTGINAFC